MTDKPKQLAFKLCLIMKEAGTIAKKGYNDFNKYSYIKESDVAQKMQELYCKHNVFTTSSVVEIFEKEVTNSKGKTQIYTSCKIEYTFIDAENPSDTLTVYAYGSGMDTGDKALYKALTGAHKYFLIRNFNLGSDEDAEKESPEVGASGSSAPAAKPPVGFEF